MRERLLGFKPEAYRDQKFLATLSEPMTGKLHKQSKKLEAEELT
jgi:hypothetical protein